ncbi:MAG: YafY family transcriptional regulator [Candidatus Kapabacteria bacterium]|nr:YafY family transcriptional regulator [Candidatus Kapabacteria bacterium]
MQKLDRLLAIVLMLHSKRVVRAEDLSRHFGVTSRTIYRDMNTLCAAGVPIASEAGVGYSLVRGYHLPPVMFSEEEAAAIVVAAEFLRKSSPAQDLDHYARTAIAKILSIIPETTKDRIHSIQESTAIVSLHGSAYAGTVSGTLYSDFQKAIADRRVMTLTYHALGRQTAEVRDVEPLAIIHYADHWHCIAYCRLRRGIRDFRLDRCRMLYPTDAIFSPRPDFHLVDYLNERFSNDNPITARVLFDESAARFTRNRMNYGFVEEELREDGVLMTFLSPTVAYLGRWLLTYADAMRVIEPPELREYIEAVLARARERV